MAKRERGRRSKLPVAAYDVTALESSGKTRFLLTAPKPLTLVTVDPNTAFVIEAMVAEGALDADSVTVHKMKLPALAFDEERDDVKDEAMEHWADIVRVLKPIVKREADEMPRSVALDTGTEVYNLRVMGTFGKLDQIAPEQRRNMMGIPNRAYASLIESLKDAGVNVIVAHRGQQKWEDKVIRTQQGEEDTRSMMTGKFDIDRMGFKGTGFITSVGVVLAFDPDKESKTIYGKFGMKIVRCGHRPILVGKSVWGRELVGETRVVKGSFPWLASQIWPSTALEDWS